MSIDLLIRSRVRRDHTRNRAIRLHAGITQAELAAAVGVTPSAVCHWEHGDRLPQGARAEQYAAVLARLLADTYRP